MKINKIMRPLSLIGLAITAAFVFTPIMASADTYPSKPIRLLIGFPPGGSSDIVARLIAKPLGERLGKPVVVENKPGAGGIIAADFAAKSEPDGYTLILLPSGHASAAVMKKVLPYQSVNDFAWVSTVTTYPMVLAVLPGSRFSSFPELLKSAKAEPNKFSFSSAGVGTAHHLVGELIMAESGVNMLHVPFRGGSAPLVELLAGRVDMMIDTMTFIAPLAKEKRVNILATTAPKGNAAGHPIIADSLPNVVYESWLGIAAPRNTPPAVVEQLNRELRAIIDQPDIKARLIELGGSPKASSPAEFRQRVEQDIAKLEKVVTDRKIEKE
ncbi:MAG: tripartite tricarboxylate transporter substrate binding protein [Pseudomonadota bacterium]